MSSYLYSLYDTLNIRNSYVGIGTTNPQELLHVEGGSIYVERMTNRDSNIDFAYSVLQNIDTVKLDKISTWSGPNINVDAKTFSNIDTISVGTITTDSIYHDFDNKSLSNVASIFMQEDLYIGKTLYASNLNVFGDFTTLNTLTSNTEQMSVTNAGTGPALVVTQTGAEAIASFYDDANIALHIADGAFVGIGTDAPDSRLHVKDSTTTTVHVESTTADAVQVQLTNSSGSTYVGPASDGAIELYSTAAAPMRIGTNSQEAVTILSDGNVGIGSTTPSYKLDVSGKTRVTDAFYINTNGMNTIFYSSGDTAYSAAGAKYIGMNMAWANVTTDNKKTFRVNVRCHLASDSSVAYRKFETLVTPVNDAGTNKPKEIVATEIADTNNDDFTALTHTVTRNANNEVELRVSWNTALTSYVGNIQLEVFASETLGDFTFTPISG
jgi:hypothetical protein